MKRVTGKKICGGVDEGGCGGSGKAREASSSWSAAQARARRAVGDARASTPAAGEGAEENFCDGFAGACGGFFCAWHQGGLVKEAACGDWVSVELRGARGERLGRGKSARGARGGRGSGAVIRRVKKNARRVEDV